MDVSVLLLPLAKSKLASMTADDKKKVLHVAKHICDVLLTGDSDLIAELCDSLDVPLKVRDFISSEFAHEDQTG